MRLYGEELLTPRPTPKLEADPLSDFRDCFFNIFAAALHIGGRSSTRNLRMRHAVVTGTHLSRVIIIIIFNVCIRLFIYSSAGLVIGPVLQSLQFNNLNWMKLKYPFHKCHCRCFCLNSLNIIHAACYLIWPVLLISSLFIYVCGLVLHICSCVASVTDLIPPVLVH